MTKVSARADVNFNVLTKLFRYIDNVSVIKRPCIRIFELFTVLNNFAMSNQIHIWIKSIFWIAFASRQRVRYRKHFTLANQSRMRRLQNENEGALLFGFTQLKKGICFQDFANISPTHFIIKISNLSLILLLLSSLLLFFRISFSENLMRNEYWIIFKIEFVLEKYQNQVEHKKINWEYRPIWWWKSIGEEIWKSKCYTSVSQKWTQNTVTSMFRWVSIFAYTNGQFGHDSRANVCALGIWSCESFE